MEYKIERIKDGSNFKGIEGMKVLTFISPITKVKRIDGPLNLCDYDQYYEWLRKETNKWNISISDNLDNFKNEFLSEPEVFLPIAEEDSLEYIKTPTVIDMSAYNSNFKYYFKK